MLLMIMMISKNLDCSDDEDDDYCDDEQKHAYSHSDDENVLDHALFALRKIYYHIYFT
jgi:hypothetical protein